MAACVSLNLLAHLEARTGPASSLVDKPRVRNARSEPQAEPVAARRRIDMRERIEIGYQAFVSDGGEEFGAIREVSPNGLVVYVENAGDFSVSFDAVKAVHSRKVVFDCGKLDDRLRRAIGHAHDAEVPGL